jgi:electron transfer flavoprotein beta subunit
VRIAACVKWVDTRPEVDSLTGEVRTDPRSRGASAADRAAVELACRMADTWGGTLELVCGGPAGADAMLRELGAVGAARLTRVALEGAVDSAWTAVSLALALRGADVIVCGDHSLDRGSGSVPAFVAHALGSAQALGLTTVDVGDAGEIVGTRRIGFGRAERLRVTAPAVISVEGSVASLRRAPLGRMLTAPDMPIEVVEPVDLPATRPEHTEPLRPRTHRLAPPTGASARDRIVELSGALVDRTPPRTVSAGPEEAADLIVEQLRTWGYLG